MPENLHHSLDQLALMQVKHKASGGKSLDRFKRVLEYLLLSVPVHGYVVQVDDYGQGTIVRPAAQDTLHYKLEMCGRLCKTHRHP